VLNLFRGDRFPAHPYTSVKLCCSFLDFRRAKFGLFKDPLGGVAWVRALEVGGLKELITVQASLPPCLRLMHPHE